MRLPPPDPLLSLGRVVVYVDRGSGAYKRTGRIVDVLRNEMIVLKTDDGDANVVIPLVSVALIEEERE